MLYTPDKAGHWEAYLSKRDIKRGKTLREVDSSGENNCGLAAIACQRDDVQSAAVLRQKLAAHMKGDKNTAWLRKLQEQQRIMNRAALREGGGPHMAELHMMQTDPHHFTNRLLCESNKDYRNLEKAQRQADQQGDTEKSEEISRQLREMELEAFRARQEQERKMAGYILQWGAGVGAGFVGGPIAGAGAFSGVGIALDPSIHADIQSGDWLGALHHSSYHLPLVGAGHRAYDALEEGNYLGAAGHAGLFGAEAFGIRGVGQFGVGAGQAGRAGKVWGYSFCFDTLYVQIEFFIPELLKKLPKKLRNIEDPEFLHHGAIYKKS